MSKEYPQDRKLQNSEDQERMSRILKRRAQEAAAVAKVQPQNVQPQNKDANQALGQVKEKAGSASGSNG
ncbi:MAG TPA: hypothetical protein VFR08_07845 [Candidatus Angelobacter sp.]|nr:hypothetical protein [Candidatus Angelobacter sp.]